MARPSRSVGSPDPAMVLRPATKSTLPWVGISKGSQASCVGETWTRGLTGRKQDSVSVLSGSSVCVALRQRLTFLHGEIVRRVWGIGQ